MNDIPHLGLFCQVHFIHVSRCANGATHALGCLDSCRLYWI